MMKRISNQYSAKRAKLIKNVGRVLFFEPNKPKHFIIDKHGQTLDWMLSKKRNKKTAKKFFKKMLGHPQVTTPSIINIDKKSY